MRATRAFLRPAEDGVLPEAGEEKLKCRDRTFSALHSFALIDPGYAG
jgi:hypothetical protein